MPNSPSSPSRLSAIALALAVVLSLLGLVALGVAALSIFSTVPAASTPAPTLSSSAKPITDNTTINRLAVIDHDRIYTIGPDGSDRIDFMPNGSVPTAALIWSRDGQHLIYAEVEGRISRVVSAQPDGSEIVKLYEGSQINAPFYLYGAPNDAHVAFLAPDTDRGMALHMTPIDRSEADQVLVNGQPNYASWSPDGSALVVHIGGVRQDAYVGTYVLSQTQLTKIDQNPAAFQAPFWSPRGEAQWLYARQATGGGELVIGDGHAAVPLATFEDGIAFAWSPDGQAVAYTLNTPDSFLYQGLTVIDRAGKQPHVYTKSDLLAFFWSPNGQQLAYLTGVLVAPGQVGRAGGLAARRVQQRRTLQATWHVVDLQTGTITDLNTFEPNEAFLYVIQYFDQFAQSIALWSPDSRWLVYSGQPLIGEPGVYLSDTRQPAAAPQYLGPGDFAIWSWK